MVPSAGQLAGLVECLSLLKERRVPRKGGGKGKGGRAPCELVNQYSIVMKENTLLQFLVSVFSQPAILIGFIALVGLLTARKELTDDQGHVTGDRRYTAAEVIVGTVTAAVGFLVLSGGAGIIIPTLAPLGDMVQSAFHISGVVPSNEAILGAAQSVFGPQTAEVMAFGFLVNVLLARFTPCKYIFLTGQHLVFMAALCALVLGSAGITGFSQVFLGALILGVVGAILPAFAHPFVRKVTGGAAFTIGHFNTTSYIISSLVAKFVGKNSPSTEEMRVPPRIGFLRDPLTLTTVTMTVIYVALAVYAGPAPLKDYIGNSGTNYIMYSIIQALTFGGGVAVVLFGVDLILKQIVPAFKGIARRVVPNAIPALDCPVVFPYGQNAVLIGFLASLAGGIAALFVLGPLGLPLIVPGMVAHFFDGGTSGVFANAHGGRRGALAGTIVNGVIITILPAILLTFMTAIHLTNASFGDSDFCIVGILVGLAARTGVMGTYLIIIPSLAVLVLAASFVKIRFVPASTTTQTENTEGGNS